MKLLLPILLSILMISCSSESISLNATVTKDSKGITVNNTDKFEYRKATITLNDDYVVSGIFIKPGETRTIYYEDFVLSNGDRFNVYKTKPISLSISFLNEDSQHHWASFSWDN